MEIIIRGKSPKLSAEELRYATERMSSLIMSPQLLMNIQVTISFKKEDGVYGTVEINDNDTDTVSLPRSFWIRINPKLSKSLIIQTLAHELVHVKQFARGEMKDTRMPHVSKWNKQMINHETIDYWDLPWEIEAFGREYGMYRRYTDHIRDQNIKFAS